MTAKIAFPLPPRLSMDDYRRYIADNWKSGNAALMQRQKAIEKNIEKPFRMSGNQSLSDQSGLLVHEGDAAGNRPGAVESDRARRGT